MRRTDQEFATRYDTELYRLDTKKTAKIPVVRITMRREALSIIVAS